MATFIKTIHTIAEFIRWNEKRQLILRPKFQRRATWENEARSYLIDTVVRELPFPEIYLRKTVPRGRNITAYEVVDGQQRLRAILDFRAEKLALSKRHNPELGDVSFNMLPDSVRRRFLDYQISTVLMENATDPEVWALFERLNTYTLTLNKQEKLNAKWFGYFKQTAYKLAADKAALEAWRLLNVFSNRQISRMREVELTSDVLVAIVESISDITAIPDAYRKYNEDFPKRAEASNQFRSSLSWIANELPDAVRATRFRRIAWFYSLLVATSDALSGIPQGLGPQAVRRSSDIRARMTELHTILQTTELSQLPSGLAELHGAISRATSHIPQRLVRHKFFFAMLTATDAQWKGLWEGNQTGSELPLRK